MERKNVVIGSTVAIVAISLFVTLFVSAALVSSKTLTSSGIVATAI